jgi:hypothetical protein
MSETLDADRASAYVMREWEQAWAHSRHLETTRGQYLGFFFTAVLGVIAIAGPRLADDSFGSPSSLLILAALLLGLQFLTAFLYLAVIRLNAVLSYYLRIIFAIRNRTIPASREVVDLTPLARPPDPVRPWAGTSNVAENVLKFGLIGFPLVLAATVIRAVEVAGWSMTAFFCVLAFLVCLGTGFRVRFGYLGQGQDEDYY